MARWAVDSGAADWSWRNCSSKEVLDKEGQFGVDAGNDGPGDAVALTKRGLASSRKENDTGAGKANTLPGIAGIDPQEGAGGRRGSADEYAARLAGIAANSASVNTAALSGSPDNIRPGTPESACGSGAGTVGPSG